MKDVMINAVGFTKNPLGVIGLFISLIYSCSSFVMTSKECLDWSERVRFIWFLVIFPIAVLAAFIY